MVLIFSKLTEIQLAIAESGFDGWLLYDFRKTNDLACRFLDIPSSVMLTRRFFYWIPKRGTPVKIVHRIERKVLDHLPGTAALYSSWEELESQIQEVLKSCKIVCMEYSPGNAIPYVSKVDAGTIEQVRGAGVKVVSSADLLQRFTSAWDDEQLHLHLYAASVLNESVNEAWKWIAENIRKGEMFTEWDVQRFLLNRFAEAGCITDDPPICAVNEHSADPHYMPDQSSASLIRQGDFILIDLWCKSKKTRGVYADITRVGVADKSPSAKQQIIFNIVKQARDAAMSLLHERLSAGQKIQGWEVDQVCRTVIDVAGYSQYFTHRTGHSIGERDHGDGANIDNFETKDNRRLLPRTCFSIEPGIYLPGEFGVRLEHDVYIESDGRSCRSTGNPQNEVVCLLQ